MIVEQKYISRKRNRNQDADNILKIKGIIFSTILIDRHNKKSDNNHCQSKPEY